MEIFYHICEWLLILSLIGFFGAIAWIGFAAIKIKNSAMADAKRLYVRPMNSVKSIITTGKGIAFRETVRFKRVAVVVKGTAASVKDAASDVQTAMKSIHPEDLKPVSEDFQFVAENITNLSQIVRVVSKLTTEAN